MTDSEKITLLRTAMHKIAYDAYTKADEQLTSTQPAMIWQLVAENALKKTD